MEDPPQRAQPAGLGDQGLGPLLSGHVAGGHQDLHALAPPLPHPPGLVPWGTGGRTALRRTQSSAQPGPLYPVYILYTVMIFFISVNFFILFHFYSVVFYLFFKHREYRVCHTDIKLHILHEYETNKNL